MPPLAKRVEFHDVEHGKSGDALGVRRCLKDAPAVIRSGNGLYPLGLVIGEVGFGEKAVVLVRELDNGIRDRTTVEGAGAVFRNQAEAVGKVWVAEDLPNPRICSIRKKDRGEGGPVFELRAVPGPVVRVSLSDRKAVFGQSDGRGKVD